MKYTPWKQRWIISILMVLAVTVNRAGSQESQSTAKKLSLEECLALSTEHQPALAAARASLSAAHSGQQALARMRLARLVSKDIPIRKQQACLGVAIAEASLQQAEWETRYAVTRNFYSVLYAQRQEKVVHGVVAKLDDAIKITNELLKKPNPKIKITTIDRDHLILNRDFYKAKGLEATVGIKKAKAALREAIGLDKDYALDVDGDLPALVDSLDKAELVALALSRRSEMVQALYGHRVTELEIAAQSRLRFKPVANTFAAGSDLHARSIPQGVATMKEYRPAAIGLEMPTMLVGKRPDRVQRAWDLHDRSGAVVDKTQNLITLEAEATYLDWLEAAEQVKILEKTPALAKNIAKTVDDRFKDGGNATGEEVLKASTLENQAQAQLNDALYHHALALAALERVTAGGYTLPARK